MTSKEIHKILIEQYKLLFTSECKEHLGHQLFNQHEDNAVLDIAVSEHDRSLAFDDLSELSFRIE